VIIKDRQTGRSRGFGFVTMGSAEEAQKAIDDLNQKEFDGRAISVSVAQERTERPQTGGFRPRTGGRF
jgi:RNA recognition motif-containing protein